MHVHVSERESIRFVFLGLLGHNSDSGFDFDLGFEEGWVLKKRVGWR